MPGALTDEALEFLEDPNDDRVHRIRPETVRWLDGGMLEAMTVCGERIVGYPSHEPSPHPTCPCCLGQP